MYRVISSKGCVYCTAAKNLLTSSALPYEEIPADSPAAKELIDRSHMRSFPIIYLGDDLVGGYQDLLHGLDKS